MVTRIVIAGAGFPLVRAFLEDALPGARLEAMGIELLRRGFVADVLLPAMSRVDGVRRLLAGEPLRNCVNAEALRTRGQ